MRKLRIIGPIAAALTLTMFLAAAYGDSQPGHEHLQPITSIADAKSHPTIYQHPTPSGQPVEFKAVSRSTLDRAGLSLSSADTPPGVTQSTAEASARADVPGRNVIGSVYAHCAITGAAVDTDCWVTALDPTGETSNPPIGETPKRFTYDLVLVDGATGNVIVELRGN
jgi:hypothetical protein